MQVDIGRAMHKFFSKENGFTLYSGRGLVLCAGVLSYVHGSKSYVQGSKSNVQGSKSYVQGSKPYVQGSKSYVQGSKSHVQVAKFSNSVFL